jgi:HlyD family secretion protein
MKTAKIIIALSLCLAVVGASACSSLGGSSTGAGQQEAKVVQGNLVVSVSGSGNVETSKEAKLTFSSGGKVDRILVKEGDHVSIGQVLAKLDTTDLALALTQAEIGVTSAQLAVSTANVSLKTAEHNLEQGRDKYTWPDIQTAQHNVDDAKAYQDYVSTNLENATTAAQENMWSTALIYAQTRVASAEAVLDSLINNYDTEEVAIMKMQVDAAELTLDLRQQSLGQAYESLAQAQKDLDEATITAPFDGVIADVYVDEGDTVPSSSLAPTTIIYMVDPNNLKLEVEVDEIDMPGVKVGQKATVSVDALPNDEFEGVVSAIYPVPSEQSGVVVYTVKIDLPVPEGSGLRVGMSTDADIITSERDSVLLVPDRAVKQDSQGNTVVEVKVNGQFQQRKVITGISDGIDTEIVQGLNEGDVVLVGGTTS